MTPLRIAIVAHGRFHAFDLARELQTQGEDVTVFSNYPVWAVKRFGLDPRHYSGLPAHGTTDRMAGKVPGAAARSEAWRHRWFGRWAARALEARPWDVVHSWSGVSEELLASSRIRARCRALMRGSAHIAEQDALLRAEEARVGVPIDRPSAWMIAREQREYARANRIVVLSAFARASFERQGVAPDKLSVLSLGVDVRAFRSSPEQSAARLRRIRDGHPLTVLYVGALSAQKGLRDLVAASQLCQDLPIRFVLVGPRLPETAAVLDGAGRNVAVLGARDQRELPRVYETADLFVFPTIQDGFGMVLTQARAAGLPVLCTANCAGPELVVDGRDGWVLPIRSPEAFADRLRWCHDRRDALADIVVSIDGPRRVADWADVARAFVDEARTWIAAAPIEARA